VRMVSACLAILGAAVGQLASGGAPVEAGGVSELSVLYIAMGEGAAEGLFAYSVQNLRERGGFRGEVFVITDRPQCVPTDRRYVTTIVPVSKSMAVLGADRAPIDVNSSKLSESLLDVSYYKTHKMRLFELLPPRVQYVLYLDTDVIPALSLVTFLGGAARLGMPRHRTRTDPHVFDIAVFREVRSRPTANSSTRAVMGQPYHTGAVLMKRGLSEGCLEKWLSNVLEAARAKPSYVVRDQMAIGLAIKTSECTPFPLDAKYLYKVTVRKVADLRALQHVTRTGLVHHKLLDESDWGPFGEVLLDINGSAANLTRATLVRRVFDWLFWRNTEPTGFRWWAAANPECVPFATGSVQAQAVALGWLPLTKSPQDVVMLHSSDAAFTLLMGAVLAAAVAALALRRGHCGGARQRHRAGASRILDIEVRAAAEKGT